MFSRRHYEAIAKVFHDLGFEAGNQEVAIEALADMLQRDNPRFDKARFLAACQPTED